ncbi:Glutamyl-Q tRNA(Asp) synthetase [Kyrpidia spormannii]|uniref:Glutamyl-Q tRNA(Asp) synthetase n=2 Tax=Kyrpidia spormannii TaxID=2055160 RepID=A0A6F9EEJ1_9BACL|nr:Glutamyl-Q tRNA(Asp) synthetase [Kyrpidia spormannii]
MMAKGIRGRFAPSPTGFLHLGHAWVALLSWLQVRGSGGSWVLRVEDLDPDRSRDVYAEALREDLTWLGLDPDEGFGVGGLHAPYRQSERVDRYEAAFRALRERGEVYPCFCTRSRVREAERGAALAPHGPLTGCPGRCAERPERERRRLVAEGERPHWRYRVRRIRDEWEDGCRGHQRWERGEGNWDPILRRRDGTFGYMLAVVVDDGEMQITDVLRGDDLLTATPIQRDLFETLGLPVPRYAHVPLLVDSAGRRLSKRHGALALRELRRSGVKPEAVIGRLAAWAGCVERPEPCRPGELIGLLNLAKVGRRWPGRIVVQER